jgi:ribosome-binding factor A
MASRRMLKAAEAIREVVSMAILTEIRDPRVQNVTVTGVEVTPDMRAAKVLVSVMADEPKQHLCLKGLANSTGFLQSKIAKRVETRYTPKITFELDQGVKKSIEVQRILYELAEERKQREQGQATDSAAPGTDDDSDALDGDALNTSDTQAALESAEDAADDADGKTS